MFDALNDFVRQTADTILHAIDGHASRIEIRALAHLERIVHNRFDRMESRMSAQSDAFGAAMSTLAKRITDLAAEMRGQVDAARNAQAAQDDEAFKAATAQIKAMTVSLSDHATAIAQTASASTGAAVPAAPAPAQAAEPVPAPAAATDLPTPAPDAPVAEAVAPVPEPTVPAQPSPTGPVVEPAPVDVPKPFTAEPESAEDRAAAAPASTVVP